MADIEGEQKTEEISTTPLEGDSGSDNDEENEVIDTKPEFSVDINNYLPKKNLTASSTFSHSIANLVNRTDLHNCIHLQHEIYKRMNDSQRALQTFNTFSAKEFNKLAPEIERKTKMIQAMKKDLYSIFDRISELREVLGDKYPEYAVLLPEEMEEEEDDFPVSNPNTPVVERMSFSDVQPIEETKIERTVDLTPTPAEEPKELPTESLPQPPEPTQITDSNPQPSSEPDKQEEQPVASPVVADPSPEPEVPPSQPVEEPVEKPVEELAEKPVEEPVSAVEQPIETSDTGKSTAEQTAESSTEENHEKAELGTEEAVVE